MLLVEDKPNIQKHLVKELPGNYIKAFEGTLIYYDSLWFGVEDRDCIVCTNSGPTQTYRVQK